MGRTLRITLICLAAVACWSCTGERAGGETVRFGVAPTVAGSATGEIQRPASRAKVNGTAFPGGTMIGLRITAPSASPAISPIYNHFFASFNGVTWLYYLDNVSTGDRLSGFSNWGTIIVDGYHPYNGAVTDLTRIPFRIASLNGGEAVGTESTVATDHMVAGSQSKNMSIPDPPGDIPLRFAHVMTAVEFEVNRPISSVPLLHLTDVTFEISGGTPAREFMISGTYNAINPDIGNMADNVDEGDTASKLVVSYPSSPNLISLSVYRILLVMMPELRQTTTADDATITMTFRFTDQDGDPYAFGEIPGGNPSVSFKLSDIANEGDDNGLLAGRSYTVKALLGYYTKFVAPTTGIPMVNHVDLVDDPHNEFVDI